MILSIDKTGSCPALPGVSTPCVADVDECFMDYDCVKDKKCCSNGCYTVCVPPAENIIAPAAAGTENLWVCLAYVQWKPALIGSLSGHQNLVSTFRSNNVMCTHFKSVRYGQWMDDCQQIDVTALSCTTTFTSVRHFLCPWSLTFWVALSLSHGHFHKFFQLFSTKGKKCTSYIVFLLVVLIRLKFIYDNKIGILYLFSQKCTVYKLLYTSCYIWFQASLRLKGRNHLKWEAVCYSDCVV